MNQSPIVIISIHADATMPPGLGEWGGTHAYMRELISGLARKKRKCVFITRRVFESLPEYEQISEYVDIYRVDIDGVSLVDKKKLNSLHAISKTKIQSVIQGLMIKPYILHSVYWNSGRVAMELSSELGIPWVHTVISNVLRRRIAGVNDEAIEREKIEHLIFSKTSKILCVSRDEKDGIISLYGIPEDKIAVVGQEIHNSFISPVHNSIGNPLIKPLGLGANYSVEYAEVPYCYEADKEVRHWWNERAFLYFGRIDTNKGVIEIVSAWELLYKRNNNSTPPLWIAGGSPKEIDLIRNEIIKTCPMLDTYERSGKIHWWGYLDPNGLSTLLLRSIVCIMHSRYEPGGRVVVEAMSQGVPVIGTDKGFALDYIKNWYNGFLVTFGDIETLSRRMEYFIHQPLLRSVMGENARNTAINIRSEWRFLDMHCEIYENINKNNMNVFSGTTTMAAETCITQMQILTYPYFHQTPDIQSIKEFLESYFGHKQFKIKQLDMSSKASIRWLVKSNGKTYILKHHFSRLALSALWDPTAREQIVFPATQRFHTERFSSLLPGMAKIEKYCASNLFILQKYYETPKLNLSIEILKQMVLPIRQLNSISVGRIEVLFTLFHPNWLLGSLKNILSTNKFFKEIFEMDEKPWYLHADFSIRLAWAKMIYKLSDKTLHLTQEQSEELIETAYRFTELAKVETNFRPGISHGNMDIEHFVLSATNDFLLLGDEKLHPSFPGKDIASLLIDFVDKTVKNDLNTIEELYEIYIYAISLNKNEVSLHISWIGLLTLDLFLMNNVLLNEYKSKLMLSHFYAIANIAKTLTSHDN